MASCFLLSRSSFADLSPFKMPTVIRPHPEIVGKCTYTPSPNRDFFKHISAGDQSRESVQTSVSDADDGTIVACENGFVYSVLRAWQQHLQLELRPDDVWLAVLSNSASPSMDLAALKLCATTSSPMTANAPSSSTSDRVRLSTVLRLQP